MPAQVVLTSAESRKLIAKAIARLDVVRQAACIASAQLQRLLCTTLPVPRWRQALGPGYT